MNVDAIQALPARPLLARLVGGALTNKLSVLVVCYAIAKIVLYHKIGLEYLTEAHPWNDFFPVWLYRINPLYLDAALIGLMIAGTRLAFVVALPLSFLLVVHPNTFGYQHYVMSSYMFVWLALKDARGSIWFGRVTLSFLYLAATIGKSTPGWISGEHYHTYLQHLHQNPYLILGGEFLFGISFLLPFYPGVLIPIVLVMGMIHSIWWGILDAVGPILGMLLTFVIYRESKETGVEIALPSDNLGRVAARCLEYLQLPGIVVLRGKGLTPTAIADGVTSHGATAWAALFARIPVLSLAVPLLTLRRPSQLLQY